MMHVIISIVHNCNQIINKIYTSLTCSFSAEIIMSENILVKLMM